MKMFYTYVDYTLDGKPFYVGKGNDNRIKGFNRNKKWKNVAAKHGYVRKLVVATTTESEALDYEAGLIKALGTFHHDDPTGLGCNMTLGGEIGPTGMKLSPERKRAIGEYNRMVRIYPPKGAEERARISAGTKAAMKRVSKEVLGSNKGKKCPKISEALKGQVQSLATQQKRSATLKEGYSSGRIKPARSMLGRRHRPETLQKMRLAAWVKQLLNIARADATSHLTAIAKEKKRLLARNHMSAARKRHLASLSPEARSEMIRERWQVRRLRAWCNQLIEMSKEGDCAY